MTSTKKELNPKQRLFQELFVGSLIYVTVLGFFNDYTSIVEARSFSTMFFAAVVLEIMTYLAFLLKGRIVSWLRGRSGFVYRMLLFFCVWLVMFLSKFVFIWVLDLLFDQYVKVNGFFGILLVVVCVTITHRLAFFTYSKLGEIET